MLPVNFGNLMIMYQNIQKKVMNQISITLSSIIIQKQLAILHR